MLKPSSLKISRLLHTIEKGNTFKARAAQKNNVLSFKKERGARLMRVPRICRPLGVQCGRSRSADP